MKWRHFLSSALMVLGLAWTGSGTFAEAQTTQPATNSLSPKQVQLVDKITRANGLPRIEPKDLQAFLMVYFKDETHGAYFAVSSDGYSFTDVNGGEPVVRGEDVAEQKGVRDPHIMRGPDGAFYLAMTDLHIYGQRKGFRQTQWERPAEYGWGNNRALVFMKSFDLIHWTHSNVRIDKLFPEFGDYTTAWAPETIFDPAKGKLMVYYSTAFKGGKHFLVYAYADDAFTTLETMPKTLFAFPNGGGSAIDGDITQVGDTYHLFYKADNPPSIRHAASKMINEGYSYEAKKIEPETAATEAPTLWRRNGTDTYVLMYDVYGGRPNNMGFSETTDFINYKDLGRFNAGVMKGTNFDRPKHGAVVSITKDEMSRLQTYFSEHNN